MEEELEDDGAIVGQHALKLDDVAVGLAPRLLRDGPVNALVQHAKVPASIEDHHLAAVRHLQPEAPQPGTLLLVGAGRGDGIELEPARVQALGESGDCRALAGSVPAFEDNHRRHAVVPARLFQIVETMLHRRQRPLVLLPREFPLEVDVFEHGSCSILVHSSGGYSRNNRRGSEHPCRVTIVRCNGFAP